MAPVNDSSPQAPLRGLSRRACLTGLAGATVMPAAWPAQAQIDWHKIDIWKPYRRDDLGFEVELPGEPEIAEEEDADGKSIHASFMFIGMMLSVSYDEFERAASIDRLVKHHREAAQTLDERILRESPFTMGAFAAIEIVSESDDGFVSITRAVVMGKRMITIRIIGGPDIAANPSAQRFLNSFKLLASAR